MWRAHPRSRGENALAGALIFGERGSSPLTRGKPAVPLLVIYGVRLIPAHAGKTAQAWIGPRPAAAHPRSRGENGMQARRTRLGSGSSPLTRGKQLRGSEFVLGGGLIPAHAGKTPTSGPSRTAPTAHPRSRGENQKEPADLEEVDGSSPLTRGKLRDCNSQHEDSRLIPAHAGKTRPPNMRVSLVGAHPRSRGENTQAECRG